MRCRRGGGAGHTDHEAARCAAMPGGLDAVSLQAWRDLMRLQRFVVSIATRESGKTHGGGGPGRDTPTKSGALAVRRTAATGGLRIKR